MIIKGKLKTLGNSVIKGSRTTYRYIDIGQTRIDKVYIVDQLKDDLERNLGQEVELSLYKSRLWGWFMGRAIIGVRLQDGRVFKANYTMRQLIGGVLYLLFETAVLVGIPVTIFVGWLMQIMPFFAVLIIVPPVSVILILIYRIKRYQEIYTAFGKENLGTLKRI